ncbi:MAG: FtsW/RodA/SpoVE family cell cycle protein, partial [Deltaproteobacteria bacterium]|nr:FtsW/RodA/SpoVE family cell cycle protein [Deltaproteobacteria bacterium]
MSIRDTRRVERSRANPSHEVAISTTSIDSGLLLSALVLVGVGVVMSYSTTAPLAMEQRIPPLFLHHMTALTIGLATATAAAFVPVVLWHRIAMPIWFVGVTLLFATFLFGVEVNGAQRWLSIPGLGVRFQPVEPVKFATLLAVAAIIAPQDGRAQLSRARALMAIGAAAPV